MIESVKSRLFLLQEQHCITILELYMPSSEHPQESYLCYLQSVEHIITQLDADGPLLLLGDLNAHLGRRSDVNQTNHKEEHWNNLISNYNLPNVPLGSLASGPVHTFQSYHN